MGETAAIFDGSRWVSISLPGPPGTSLTVKGSKPTVADLPTTSVAGEAWIVAGDMHVSDGTAFHNIGAVTGPAGAPGIPGSPGPKGDRGDRGSDGTSATIRVGSVTSGPTPGVTNTGTNSAAVLNFVLAKGDTGPAGPKGDQGDDATVTVAATNTLPTGSPATVSASGAGGAISLTFGIPKGDAGPAGTAGTPGVAGTAGKDGTSATVTMGTVTTLAAGQPATAKNTGTSSAAVIELSIPQGSQGMQGPAGPAGTAGKDGAAGAAGAKGDKGDTGAAGKDGSGVTISGTQNGGTWPPTGTHTKGEMILLGTPLPTGVPAGSKTGDGMVYDGAAWQNVGSVQGPAGAAGAKGDAGPSAVSTDAGNYSKLGADKLIFTPTPTIPAAATANPLTDGTSAPGVSLKYAREDHVHPLPTLTALGAAATKHTHAASTDITGLATVATSGKYADLTGGYTLPEASATVLGGIKVGTGLSIAAGVLSASGTSASDATTTTAGLVTLADAAAITAGTVGKIPDAAQMKGQVDVKAPKANPAFTGVVYIPLGTAAAPSLTFTGDTDTGIYEAAANTVGIAAGGVSALEVTATGTTVAGTLTAGGLKYPNTPGTKDQVLSSDGAGNVAWTTVAAGTTYTLPAATPLALGGVKVADAAAVTLGAAGYVVDAAQLKAAAYTLPDATASKVGGVTLADATAITAGTAGKIVDAAQLKASADLHVKKAGDNMTGTLALNSATPAKEAAAAKLVVVGANAFTSNLAESNTKAAVSIRPNVASGYTLAIGSAEAANIPYLQSVTLNGGAASGPLTLNPYGGNVGIGKSGNPTSTLDVVGTVAITGGITSKGTAHSFAAGSIARAAVAGVSETDLDARYVNVDGDTMTGLLTVNNKNTGVAQILNVNLTSVNAANQGYGSQANIDLITKNTAGYVVSNTGKGTVENIAFLVTSSLPASVINWAFYSDSFANNYFRGSVGIGMLAPTVPLEVVGNSKLRGTLDVTGNITSTGAAHNFVAKSIPVSALSAFPTVPTGTPASQTATGVAGQMEWDANYLYLAIAANQWRRVPWTDWHGNTLPGSGAGATDTALAAPATTTTALVKAAAGTVPAAASVGHIVIALKETPLPPLSTGVKVQYRIHGGNWVDATVSEYTTSSAADAKLADYNALKMANRTGNYITISGPPPGTPYLTRVAYTSSLGVGAWSDEMTAVTPTA